METSTEKPFICTSDGCDMSFSQEDHLNAHEIKHKMLLDLGFECNKNTFTADQTPTPTRFIRNCEEVGLFQDLQNVNPFDETFRKAVELAESGSLHVPEATNDDTLHTPNLFPHIIEQNGSSFSVNNVASIETELLKLNADKIGAADGNLKDSRNDISTFEIVDLSTTEVDIPHGDSDKNDDTSKSKKNGMANIKEALKIKLVGNSGNNKYNNEKNDQAILITPLELDTVQTGTIIFETTMKLPIIDELPRKRHVKPVSIESCTKKSKQSLEGENSDSASKTTMDSKERQRAINREAQFRSRQRKKRWLSDIEKKIEQLTEENKRLLLENQNLKRELILCNTVISHHNNCSVSKDKNAMDELQSVIDKTKKELEIKTKPSNKNGSKMKPIRPYPSPQAVVLNSKPIILVSNVK